MADLQAQRTLVKSPPELWAELSNPDSLARRLAEFGEIRITRLIPEQTVAWEGERASGTVELESSGWGTRVRLTATAPADGGRAALPAIAAVDRITAVIADDEQEDLPAQARTRAADLSTGPGPAERSAARMAVRAAAAAQAAQSEAAWDQDTPGAPLPEAPPPPRPETAAPAPASAAPSAPRRGFLARLFGRRRTDPADVVAAPVPDPQPPPPAPRPPIRGSDAAARYAPPMPGSSASPPPGPTELDREQTIAVLSSVLDDLGAAHHRPFSRG